MRIQKVRGHNRCQKQIKKWVQETKHLNLTELFEWRREYAEILIHPWSSGSSLIDNVFPEPNKKTKELMLEGLLEIYESWKIELDKLHKPYYLKIWLYEPRISKSQIVCAIDDKIAHYEKLFIKLDKPQN